MGVAADRYSSNLTTRFKVFLELLVISAEIDIFYENGAHVRMIVWIFFIGSFNAAVDLTSVFKCSYDKTISLVSGWAYIYRRRQLVQLRLLQAPFVT